ncbi:MAG: type 4a pilus biogenesis protein PilO [Bdellovibrionales bacterium]|nr:type 4a pilus biogenesis protein PilO [Bdellovibrionales bacterium]
MKVLLNLANHSIIQIFVFGAIFGGLYYFTFYDDGENLRKEIKQVQEEVKTTQDEIKKTEQELENALIFKKEIEFNEEMIQVFLDFVPSSLTFTDVSTLIIEQARLSGVNIESKRDGSVEDISNYNYQTLNMEIEITGSFYQLMFFLSSLTKQKRMLIVNEIDIKLGENNILLSSTIKLLAYRYKIEDEKPNEDEKTT